MNFEFIRRLPQSSHGLLLFAIGTWSAFVLMANDGQLRLGVPLGAFACLAATLGLLSLRRTNAPTSEGTRIVASVHLGSHVAQVALAIATFIAVTRAVVNGTLPGNAVTAAVLLPLLLGAAAVLLYRTADALGVFSRSTRSAEPLYRHPSLYLLLITIAIYTPMLGSYSLIDPWETHYGEVAREILARDDWMSLWWAQDGFFWSKPVLDFWLQALSFATFGVRHAPDQMLSAVTTGHVPYPEWAARLPMLILSLIGQALLYAGVKAHWGRRASFLGSLLLVAVPHYALIVHQSMTDLPYIATLMAAAGLLLLGINANDSQLVRSYLVVLGKYSISLSANELVLGSIVLSALPQIIYLLSRNVGLVSAGDDLGFYVHADRFFSGSGGGNCGLPGNENCAWHAPEHPLIQPFVTGLVCAAILAALVVIHRGERRRKRLHYLGAWYFVALSAMAKGLPGPVLFVVAACVTLALTDRYAEGLKLMLPSALMILLVVAAPWFVQCTIRHGSGFIERLFIHDMYKRAFEHVHDTNAGDDVTIRYYLWQLGYGLFPATGIITMGALSAVAGSAAAHRRGAILPTFLSAWFLAGFSMFTLTLTKFHHYIIPVVPPLCVLAGPLLSDAIEAIVPNNMPRQLRRTSLHFDFVAVGLSAATMVVFAGFDLFGPSSPPGGGARIINLVTYNYARLWPEQLDFGPTLAGFTVVGGLSALGFVAPMRLRAWAGIASLTCALCFGIWTCNRYLPLVAPHWGQRETVATYYHERKGPEEPLVAYQMNWKGENFYTGNRLATFISTGERFTKWVKGQRDLGRKVLFFTLEHTRLGNLKSELGPIRKFEVLTNKQLNNKFAMVRVTL